jgi:hypothetical protein
MNRATEEKLWDNEINIPLSRPHELNDNNEASPKFKCNIDEKAINFFRSKYLKQEHAITNAPNNVNVNRHAATN